MSSKEKLEQNLDQNDNLFFKEIEIEKYSHESEFWPIATEGELAVDVYETEKEIIVRAAIAGIRPEDLRLSLDGDVLTIRGTRENYEYSTGVCLCKECHWGPFSRSIILPSKINTSKIKAQLERGVLTINLPKAKKEMNIKVKEVEE
jgi:HSP20 family protein